MNSMASQCFDGNIYYYKKISSFVQKSKVFDQFQPK